MATLFRILLPTALAGYMTYVVIAGLKAGVMRTRGGDIHRRKQPRWFWAIATLFSSMAFAFASFAHWTLLMAAR